MVSEKLLGQHKAYGDAYWMVANYYDQTGETWDWEWAKSQNARPADIQDALRRAPLRIIWGKEVIMKAEVGDFQVDDLHPTSWTNAQMPPGCRRLRQPSIFMCLWQQASSYIFLHGLRLP